jgi:hypothetical protein
VDVLVALAVVALLAAVVWLVGAPLRRGATDAAQSADAAERERLEAAKEAKYREIRDAELDYRTGKLDEADFKAADRQLRAEAIELLHAIDKLGS